MPPPYRDALRTLGQLDDEEAATVVSALDDAAPYQQVNDLVETARAALPEGVRDHADLIVTALLSLRGQYRGKNLDRIGELLATSSDLEIDDDDLRARLQARITTLLHADAIATTANAVDVLTHHQHNFQTATVFTDLRPLFGDDPQEQPTGGVIVEMLHLQTWKRDGSMETFYIALDEADLLELRDAVDRALAKTESLKVLMRGADMSYFELDRAGV